MMSRSICKLSLVLLIVFASQISFSQKKDFRQMVLSENKPWTDKPFMSNPNDFQFAIVSDRTGGHRKGVFSKAVKKLNLLMPEFVMSVGDLIEGYTKLDGQVHKEWTEFDSLVDPLDMKFFALPGNHDISNDVMRKIWIEKYGVAYYHFMYKDVLFLAMDTNDGNDDATLSKKQIDYFKKVIQDNKDARWVMIFMHHPVWLYDDFSGFKELEKVLPKERYTVYAGHVHYYLQMDRNDTKYYALATTGGGSELRGPKFGEFDHITWITMTDKGPKMLNLRLNGMIEHDVVDPAAQEKKKSLIAATNFKSFMTYNQDRTAGKIHFGIKNKSSDTLFFDGKVFHNHHLDLQDNELNLVVAPHSFKNLSIDWELSKKSFFGRFDPVELDFTLGYKTDPLDNPFQLEGTYTIPKRVQKELIQFTEPNLFSDKIDVSLLSDIDPQVIIKYTVDGSTPTKKSKTYTEPISLSTTSTVKAAFFDRDLQHMTGPLEMKYSKVALTDPIQVSTKKNGLNYSYYEGDFTQLPKFESLQTVKKGVAHDFDVERIADTRLDHYAIKYDGYINVPQDGLYTFYTHSDDGSQLYIHDKLVVDNGGSHSARTRKGYISLAKGIHPIRLTYFEDFLGQKLSLYWKVPNMHTKEKVDFKYLFHR